MKRKIMAFILGLCLILSNVFPAYALSEGANSGDAYDVIDAKNKMLRILTSVAYEKEEYGLDDVDLSNIEIGDEIPTYRVEGDILVDSDIHIIPVISNNKLVSCFYIAEDINGELCVSLSKELVDVINSNVSIQEFSIIYDDIGAYIYTEGEVTLLGEAECSVDIEYEVEMNEQGDFIEESYVLDDIRTEYKSSNEVKNVVAALAEGELESIQSGIITVTDTLNLEEYLKDQPSVYAVSGSKYLNVDKIQQPVGTNICWAITLTSIVNHILKGSMTYNQMVTMVTGGVDKGLSPGSAINALNLYFNASYYYEPVASTITASFVLEQLMDGDGYPLYGSFLSNNYGHAVVIRGVNTIAKSFSVMNPTPTTNNYTAGTISSSNVWTFISGYGGGTYTLRGYGYHFYAE